jgi:hypothetical protein
MPEFEDIFQSVLGSDWPTIRNAFLDETRTLPAALRAQMDLRPCPRFMAFLAQTGNSPSSTEQGAAFATLDYLRFKALKRPHFVVDDDLVELLELTDIAEDIPVSYLTPPFQGLYLELGQSRTHSLTIANVTTGDHLLEGAYIEQGMHQNGRQSLHVLLVGSPVGKSGPLDDATQSLVFDLSDPDRSLAEVLSEQFEQAVALSKAAGLRATPVEFRAQAMTAVLMMAKVLLYLNLPDVRRTLHANRTAAEKDLARLKSTGKKAKAARRIGKLYDYVLVSSSPTPPSSATIPDTGKGQVRTVKGHWRRGHLRMQAHGPQHSLRRLTHIRPVLVSGAASDEVAAATYRVK